MPEPEKPVSKTTANPEKALELEQPTGEITQTDRINKQLLASLFKRMDEGDSVINTTSESDNNTTEDDEWKD